MRDDHTKGPWKVEEDRVFQIAHPTFRITICTSNIADYPEEVANTKLITAAVNSYDKHCGDRAVECAEGDLLGECLEVLDALDLFTLEVDRGLNKIENLKHIVSAANKVLAKTKGE